MGRCIQRDDRYLHASYQFISVTQLCPTLCDPMDCNTPGIYIDGRYMHTEIYISVYMYIYLHRWQIHTYIYIYIGLPWWLSGKESTCQHRKHGYNPWVRKISWRRKWPATILLELDFLSLCLETRALRNTYLDHL